MQLGGILVESVQEVSGLSVEQEVVETKQVTNSGEQLIRKQPGARQAGEVTIVRGLDKSSAFTDWIKETLNNVIFSIGPDGVQQQAGTGSVSGGRSSSFGGALLNSRHRLASVARNWWRCTTMSTMPCSRRYSAR